MSLILFLIREPFNEKAMSKWLNLNGGSPVCISECLIRNLYSEKNLSQIFHIYGFFPVWFIKWLPVCFFWEILIRKTTFTDMICQHCESLYALKMARLGKRLVTLSRVVWFVTFLTYHVTSKLTSFKERLATFSTSVWFTTSVGPYMIFTFSIWIEIHVTHTTLVYFFTSVTHLMCHKSPSFGESFTTMATLVLFSPVWVPICLIRLTVWEKAMSHWLYSKGF